MSKEARFADMNDYSKQLSTYIPIAMYVFMIGATILFKWDDHILTGPLVVSSCTLLILFIHSIYLLWKKANSKIDTYPAMICWTCWLTYGLVFKGAGGHIPDVVNMISGVGLLAIATTLYRPGLYDIATLRVAVKVLYAGFILMLPNEDSIPTDCGTFWIILKATLFYILYIACNSERKIMASRWLHMMRASNSKVDVSKIHSFGGEKLFYNSVERTILQSVWILFVKSYFIPIGFVAIGAISWWITKNTNTYATYKKSDDDVSSKKLSNMEKGGEPERDDSVTIIESITPKNGIIDPTQDGVRDLATRGDEIGEEVIIEDLSEYLDSVDDGIDDGDGVVFEDISDKTV